MANPLDALTAAAKQRVASSAKDAKESVINQFDPRKSIYGLGMGVGPLIRQTVAEYKKQQDKGSRDRDAKKNAKDIVDVKAMAATNKTSLNKMNAQLSAMNSILGDIRKINNAQLQALKVTNSNQRQSGAFSAAAASEIQAREESSISKLGKWIADKFPGATATAAGGVATYAAYKYKDEIKQSFEDYLQGAGLPSSAQLQKQAAEQIQQAGNTIANKISGAVTEGIQQAVVGLPKLIVDTWWNNMKMAVGAGTDRDGRPAPQDASPLGRQVGSAVGGSLGFKYAPGLLKIPAAAAGYFFGGEVGEQNPGATIGGAALAMGGYGAYKLRQAAIAKSATKAAEAAAATQAANAAKVATPPTMPTQPWQTPTGAPVSNVRMSPGGIILPESTGARSPEAAKKIAEAATKTLTASDKASVAARNTVSSLAKYGREAASIVSKYGKGMVGLSAMFGLPDIYDDIKDGDYAAAGVRAATLIGSTAIGLTGFLSGGAGFVAGTGLSIGGNLAADALKQKNVSQTQPSANIVPTTRLAGTDRMRDTARDEIEKAQRGKNRSVSQQEMMDVIAEEFKSFGFNDIQIKAAQIAAAAESGLDPYASGDNGASIGLFQLNRVAGEGRGFTVEQLSDPNNNARIAASKMASGKQGEAFRNASTLDQALESWVRDFERPHFVRGNQIADAEAYSKYVARGSKIAGNPQDVINSSVTTALSSNANTIKVGNLRSMGLSETQIQNLTEFQETIKGFNDLSNIFTGNFDNLPGAAPTAAAAPQQSGGNSNKTPPTVPPVSMYKEKHSFGQPWYKTGGAPPLFQ